MAATWIPTIPNEECPGSICTKEVRIQDVLFGQETKDVVKIAVVQLMVISQQEQGEYNFLKLTFNMKPLAIWVKSTSFDVVYIKKQSFFSGG